MARVEKLHVPGLDVVVQLLEAGDTLAHRWPRSAPVWVVLVEGEATCNGVGLSDFAGLRVEPDQPLELVADQDSTLLLLLEGDASDDERRPPQVLDRKGAGGEVRARP
jgi:redox-sensitive bicupin YhaK (pirin superfamily)